MNLSSHIFNSCFVLSNDSFLFSHTSNHFDKLVQSVAFLIISQIFSANLSFSSFQFNVASSFSFHSFCLVNSVFLFSNQVLNQVSLFFKKSFISHWLERVFSLQYSFIYEKRLFINVIFSSVKSFKLPVFKFFSIISLKSFQSWFIISWVFYIIYISNI